MVAVTGKKKNKNTNGQTETSTDKAMASSAHSRINIPLNLRNWNHLSNDVQTSLLWFHQHILDQYMSYDEACESLGYERSVIFKILKGIYQGSWENVCKSIARYKKIVGQRSNIQKNEIVPNSITTMIGSGLDYAIANNSITAIIGESRMGKTESVLKWRDEHNHGTSVYVVAPPYGGTKMLLKRIADSLGIGKNQSATQMYEAITRAFNKNRILLVDEAHRLLPSRSMNAVNLEVLRDLHDTTKCALALVATQRFDDSLRKSEYQFEQILGRIGMPIRLARKIKRGDYSCIVRQYIAKPNAELLSDCGDIANRMGRLGILVETLKVGSQMAAKEKQTMTAEHFYKAIALRKQMMGETQWAKK